MIVVYGAFLRNAVADAYFPLYKEIMPMAFCQNRHKLFFCLLLNSIFATNKSKSGRGCNADDAYHVGECSMFSRKDRKSVIFKLMEKKWQV